ncbi:MAG: alpha/beta fold hydrolase [Caulobacterales bacterium]
MGQVKRSIVEAGGRQVFVEEVLREGPTRGSIIFVNGAVATTSALRWAVKSLTDYDLVLFDFPHLGSSRTHNPDLRSLSKEDEAAILGDLIERYRPDFLAAQSWGGTSALLALAERPPSVKKAIIASYSAGLTEVMRALTLELLAAAQRCDRPAATRLVLETLGERLPEASRRLHERYFLRFGGEEVSQVARQLGYVAELSYANELASWRGVEIPVMFMNGARDRFTPPEAIAPAQARFPAVRFAVVPEAGPFLAMESQAACAEVVAIIRGFFTRQAAEGLASPLRRRA